MANYQILYWHDRPTQVRVREGKGRVSKPLSPRFQEAVDQVAMAARLTASDAYQDGFHWSDPKWRDGSAEEVVTAVAAELEAELEAADWQELIERLRSETPL